MKKYLLATAVLLASTMASHADILAPLGPDPTSGAGAFANNDPGSVILPAVPTQQGGSGLPSLGGAFSDIFTFTLTQTQNLTIAFAVNTFAGGIPQFITGFTGAVLDTGSDGLPGGIGTASDSIVLGPELASSCVAIPNCQIFGGSAVLAGGAYYLQITGDAGVDAGYGGNISTTAVGAPGPAMASGLPGLLMLLVGGGLWFNQRRKETAAA